MNAVSRVGWSGCVICLLLAGASTRADDAQYAFGGIRVPKASADEPVRDRLSSSLASSHLDQGARAWYGARKCISCHTNGTYMLARPSLSRRLGPPPKEMRDQYVAALQSLESQGREQLMKGTRPAQVIYAAAGLAQWDAHVSGSLSPKTLVSPAW